MFSILLDELPTEWNGYEIDGDFQIGIQIAQCMADDSLNNAQKLCIAAGLLFGENCPQSYEEIAEALEWFLQRIQSKRWTSMWTSGESMRLSSHSMELI